MKPISPGSVVRYESPQRRWVLLATMLNGYTLSLSALLLLGGSLGDRYGRRRVFLIGVVWFALSSALCGLAYDSETLIAARIVQGIGAALLTPGSLAILQATFHPDDRGRAVAAWTGWGGVPTAIGPFLPFAACLTGTAANDPGQFAAGFRTAMVLAASLSAFGTHCGWMHRPFRRPGRALVAR
jgi:MFS family permease